MMLHFHSSSGASHRRQNESSRMSLVVTFIVCLLTVSSSKVAFATPQLDFENPPIDYTNATPDNVVTKLQAAIDDGEKSLSFEDQFGYLRPVLRELEVPESSQMLTFLKSSMQRPIINPQNARAVYFGDDAYVASVPGGIIEIIVPDDKLGMVFYTLDQDSAGPKFRRQVAGCMTCHSSSRTKNIPGLQVRSMMPDPEGQPVISAGSFRIDHSSPLQNRWGGWFVTGTHGKARHLGNFHLPDRKRPRQPIDNAAGANVTDLSSLTDLSKQLTPHSDIVALMVFEHQIDAHNLMVRTNYAWQIDQHHQTAGNDDAGWKQEAEKLVQHLRFKDELQLKNPLQGTSTFAAEFSQRGSQDKQHRMLRKFNLKSRLFDSPYSYTTDSSFFRALPVAVQAFVMERLPTQAVKVSSRQNERPGRQAATE